MDASDLYFRALEEQAQGRVDDAVALLEQSYDAAPHFKTALRLAALAGQRGRVGDRGIWIERAFALNGRSNEAGAAYAELLLERGEREAALAIVEDILARSPSYGPARRLRRSLEPGS